MSKRHSKVSKRHSKVSKRRSKCNRRSSRKSCRRRSKGKNKHKSYCRRMSGGTNREEAKKAADAIAAMKGKYKMAKTPEDAEALRNNDKDILNTEITDLKTTLINLNHPPEWETALDRMEAEFRAMPADMPMEEKLVNHRAALKSYLDWATFRKSLGAPEPVAWRWLATPPARAGTVVIGSGDEREEDPDWDEERYKLEEQLKIESERGIDREKEISKSERRSATEREAAIVKKKEHELYVEAAAARAAEAAKEEEEEWRDWQWG